MIIEVSLAIKIDAPEEHAQKILDGDASALLATIYTPNDKSGKWWVEGDTIIRSTNKV